MLSNAKDGIDTQVKIPPQKVRNQYKPILAQMSSDGQNYRVLKHLITEGKISSFDSFNIYGITRLSARIHDLRHGYEIPIKAHRINGKTRQGADVNYAVYVLEDK